MYFVHILSTNIITECTCYITTFNGMSSNNILVYINLLKTRDDDTSINPT